jgi:Zn-dependent alcohol dehydrogenase
MHGAVEVAGITAGDTVVVQGSGPVGIAPAMYTHLAGDSRVILIETVLHVVSIWRVRSASVMSTSTSSTFQTCKNGCVSSWAQHGGEQEPVSFSNVRGYLS